MKTSTIHIYSQQAHHDDAYIVCTKEGLRALRVMLDVADVKGAATSPMMCTDGEGYDLHIIVTEREDIALPYTEDYAKEDRKKAVWPWELRR